MPHSSLVVDRPQFIKAWMTEADKGTLKTDVFISHALEPTDPWYMEWTDYRGQFCFVIESEEEFDDEDWIMGGGLYRQGRAWVACPGDGVDHCCLHGRRADQAMPTGV